MKTKSLLIRAVVLPSLFIILPFANGSEGIPGDPWRFTVEDISSDTPTPGATTYDPAAGVYTVTADGSDIAWYPDEFRFLYIEASGDFSVSVCVLENPFQGGTDVRARGGVMVRQNNSPGAIYIDLTVARELTCDMQGRDHEGQGSWGGGGAPGHISCPLWVRLRREGNTWYGDYSTDGVNWQHQPGSQKILPMSDPVLVGICLTSREPKVLTTVRFSDFRLNGLGPQTRAEPGKDQWVYGGDTVALDGSGSALANTYHWEQLLMGNEPPVTLDNPNPPDGIAHFTAPSPLPVGVVLTFRLRVTGQTGSDSAETRVNVRATNPPKVAPSNLRALPLDDPGPGGLGFRLEWDPVFDAENYLGALKLGTDYFWLFKATGPHFDFTGMAEGQAVVVAVRGENRFSDPNPQSDPSKHGLTSEDFSYVAMRNLALPASLGGTRPPLPPVEGVTYAASHFDVVRLNDAVLDVSNDSWTGEPKSEDYWGYMWVVADEPYYFDHVVYYVGDMFPDGGWFTSLKVQYTEDGLVWKDVPIEKIMPPYDFSDNYFARKPFTRYDISIPTVKGTGIRIYGTPGGMNRYTIIAELEVFGDQTRPDLIVVQGLDAEVPEGSTAILDGSKSFSSSGPIVSYQWALVSSPLEFPSVEISNANSAIATFNAPIVSKDEVFVFSLTASDGTSEGTDNDVRIIVKNLLTSAAAGPDQIAFEGNVVQLDGSGSLSTSGSLTFLWTQTGGTDVGISGRTSPIVTFTVPTIWGGAENLTFQLRVDDGLGWPGSVGYDEVVVEVVSLVMPYGYPLGPGYFKELLHLGQSPTDRLLGGYLTADPLLAFGGEANVTPAPDDAYDFTGTGVSVTTNPMVWTPVHSDDGFFSVEADNFTQIYHIYIISPEERLARFHFRHDDEIRIWNNGLLVVSRDGWDSGEEQTQGFALHKGINSMALKYQQGAGGNYIAVAITDTNDQSFSDLRYSLSCGVLKGDGYAVRDLPNSYRPGETVQVTLSLRVNPNKIPPGVEVIERIPEGLTEADVSAPGATVSGGEIRWKFSGADVRDRTLSYSLNVPHGTTRALCFAGSVSSDTTATDTAGGVTIYAVPSSPRNLEVEMLLAAHLSWNPPPEEGITRYRIERSVNGAPWEEIAYSTETSYVDNSVLPGSAYRYRVSAISQAGMEGASSQPTEYAVVATMGIREAEDFNYGGGKFPWTPSVTVTANEAPSATDMGTPWEYDYYHPNTGGPSDRSYRPLDNRADGTGVGIERDILDVGTTDQYHTNIGWIDVGSWYRYGFNVGQPGWIKLAFRVACPNGGILAAYWDERKVGTATFTSGDWHTFTWAPLEQFEETETGPHTLRVSLVNGQMSFDKVAVGFGWVPSERRTIFAENFDSYAHDDDVRAAGWTIENGSGYPDAAWRLWDTEGPPLGNQDANIAGMYDKYMIADSDLAPDAPLDERLITNEIDCTNYTNVRLNFNKNFRGYEDPEHLQKADVDIRVFDQGAWGAWVNLLHFDRTTVTLTGDMSDAIPEEVNLSAYADNKRVQIRWRFYDVQWDYWFAVDEIRVSGEPAGPPPPPAGVSEGPAGPVLSWEAFADGEYTVTFADDLASGIWKSPLGTWPTTSTAWTDNDAAGDDVVLRFYRVESAGVQTQIVALAKVFAVREGFTMVSVPLAAADNRLNGESGCIGDMIKKNLRGGPDASSADTIWKWDPLAQEYTSAFLVAGLGEGYDGRWWDPATNDLSTMTLDIGEVFWVGRK
jgi:hypothetical protein